MTLSARLQPHLDTALRGESLIPSQTELHALKQHYVGLAHPVEQSLVQDSNDQYAWHTVIDMLAALATDDPLAALTAAQRFCHAPTASNILGGKPYLLAEKLAVQLEDTEAANAFRQLYQSYLDHGAMLIALEALGDMLACPYLSEVDGAEPDSHNMSSTTYLPPPPTFAPFAPLSNAPQEDVTRTYVVQVRKLTDATTADFAVFKAVLADLTDGGVFGRENHDGELYADLLLEFGHEALELLELLDPTTLSIRFVFKASREFESFSVMDKTLFGLEVSPEENRLYFKLKVPLAWTAAEVPLHLLWANLESCVLLSRPD